VNLTTRFATGAALLALVPAVAAQGGTNHSSNKAAEAPIATAAPSAGAALGGSGIVFKAGTGSTLWGGAGNGSALNPGSLAKIDGTTFAGTTLSTPAGGLTGITFTPDGKLWACSGGLFGGTMLYQLDPVSGATLSSVPVSAGFSFGLGDLATQPGTGKVFGWETGLGAGNLWTIDTATGVGTFVGDPGGISDWGGLAFAPNGTLYHISSQVATGQFTTLNPATGAILTSLTYGPDKGCDGLVVLNDGTLLATRGSFAGGDAIVKVNPTTGATSIVGNTGVGTMSDLAIKLGTPASCAIRLGTLGLNPTDCACGNNPVIGGTWNPTIGTAPTVGTATLATIIGIGLGGPTSGVPALGGELLILPNYLTSQALGAHSIPVPADPLLEGVAVYAQGLRIEQTGGGGIAYVPTNALDLILGL
jgi:hypothetical protein